MRKPILLLMTALLLLALLGQAGAAPSLSLPKVTPSAGEAGDLFTFTVRYTGQEPASVKLFIGESGMEMQEVDPADNSTADGKDYYLRVELEPGVSIFYFKALQEDGQEASTPAYTVNVRPSAGIRMDHLDVVFAVLVFMVPTVWALLLIRKLSADLRAILEKLRERDRSE